MNNKQVDSRHRIGSRERGASLIEYALLVAAIVGIAAYAFTGTGSDEGKVTTAIKGKLDSVVTEINK